MDELLNNESIRNHYVKLAELEVSLRGFDELIDVSEQTMKRIGGRRLPIPGDRRRSIFTFVVATAIALLIAVGLFSLSGPTATDTAVHAKLVVTGDVFVRRGDEHVSFGAGENLHPGDRITTSREATAVITYPDGTTLKLGNQSELTFQPETATNIADAKHVMLTAGKLTADVRPQASGRPMLVVTDHAVVTVVGTRFEVRADGDSASVKVETGRVFVRPPGKPDAGIRVAAGQFAIARKDKKPEIIPDRITEDLIAYYPFDEGHGNIVHDRSDFGKPLDLQLVRGGELAWNTERGVTLPPDSVLASAAASKLANACQDSGEITLEAWIEPTTLKQLGPPHRHNVPGQFRSQFHAGSWRVWNQNAPSDLCGSTQFERIATQRVSPIGNTRL